MSESNTDEHFLTILSEYVLWKLAVQKYISETIGVEQRFKIYHSKVIRGIEINGLLFGQKIGQKKGNISMHLLILNHQRNSK